jgi:NAD(P)-dependent dehydrogenase (short-subunit alcohol dehydrogenase family)
MIWRDVSLGTRPNRVDDQAVQDRWRWTTEPHEVADLALFLASPVGANSTGTEILLDGGQNKAL